MFDDRRYRTAEQAIKAVGIENPSIGSEINPDVIEEARKAQHRVSNSNNQPSQISLKDRVTTAIELAYLVGHGSAELKIENQLDNKLKRGLHSEEVEGISKSLVNTWKEELELVKRHLPDPDGRIRKAISLAQRAGAYGAELTVDQGLEGQNKKYVGTLNDSQENLMRSRINVLLRNALKDLSFTD
jgi:hypothetical protein